MKIAEGDKKARLKKIIKNTLAISAGAAAGTGASMLADRYLMKHVAKGFKKIPTHLKAPVHMAIGALGAAGMKALLDKMNEERKK